MSARAWRRVGRALVTPWQSARRELQHEDTVELLIRTAAFVCKRNAELERRLAFREFGMPDPANRHHGSDPDPGRPALRIVRGGGPEAS